VDLQASLSVHFDESSFDLLKDKISLPEHDSMGDLDMDMGSLAIKAPEEGDSGGNVAMPSADVESDSEPDFGGLLEERLRDMKITDDEVPQSKDGDGMDGISTPPTLLNYNPSSQFFLSHARLQHPSSLFLLKPLRPLCVSPSDKETKTLPFHPSLLTHLRRYCASEVRVHRSLRCPCPLRQPLYVSQEKPNQIQHPLR
jgi:hypothetical protein